MDRERNERLSESDSTMEWHIVKAVLRINCISALEFHELL
jgi:hypothetical protein